MHSACGGLGGAGDQFQQGAFAGTVDADDADGLARLHSKIDVLQHPLGAVVLAFAEGNPLAQARPSGGVLFVGFAQIRNCDVAHVFVFKVRPPFRQRAGETTSCLGRTDLSQLPTDRSKSTSRAKCR